MSKFKIGDKVKWTSQSRGVTKTKHGVVIMTRERSLELYGEHRGDNPQIAAEARTGPAHIRFDGSTWGHMGSGNDGVLVETRTTKRAWAAIHKPNLAHVELDE